MSAIAALKGYRTQFLYSLHHILTNPVNHSRFLLEGREDLDIVNQNGEIEAYIQVKNTVNPISLSDLLTEKGTSFIKRYLEVRNTGIPILVSFGPLSSELTSWKSNATTISAKEKALLKKHKISEAEWIKVKSNVEFKSVSESVIVAEIFQALKAFQQIDPEPTLENLMYWLSYVAEKQQAITYQDVFNKIEQIAVYLSERIAITNRYGLYIKPLHQTGLDHTSLDTLQKEFYYGTTARYEHILSGQDVVRVSLLEDIKRGFEQNNIVILHGASGQGKTSLAYRYAHDYTPSSLIYEVVAQDDIIATNEAITTLNAIVKKHTVPAVIIINVSPNTTHWLKIIQATGVFRNLTFLVAVRNEDWFRAKSSELNFLYADIEVNLQEQEAASIYQALLKKNGKIKYSDFKEAWLDLGGNLPLMEFTYAITQGESLFQRLQQQVLLLNAEEQTANAAGQLAILRLISLADYAGARIDAIKLKGVPNIQFIMQKFEREYLLKHTEDRKYITGLHPIRSKLLCDLLFDDFLFPKSDEVDRCLDVIEETDIYPFLLKCLYDQIVTPAQLIDIIKNKTQITWVKYRAVLKSLIWVGARDFVDANRTVFDQAQEIFGDLGITFLDVYHGVTLDLSFIWEHLDTERHVQLAELQTSVTPKSDIFKYLIQLLNTVPVPLLNPFTNDDWKGMAEVMFWLSQFVEERGHFIHLSEEDLTGAFEVIELEVLSKLMLSLHYYSPQYNTYRVKLAPVFVRRLRNKFRIPELIINDEITVNYILDITNDTEDFSIHDNVLEIIDLLRDAFPEKKKFNTQGHGHRNLMITLPFDDSKKTISVDNLPLEEWVNVNATVTRLSEYAYRPVDWIDFLNRLEQWEKTVKGMVNDFSEAFAILKRTNGGKLLNVMEQGNHLFGFEIKSPKSISDPLGIPVKQSKKQSKSIDLLQGTIKQNALYARHQQFFKNYRDFKSNIENFLKQSGKVVYERLRNMQEPGYPVDSHLLHLSYVNLYNSITSRAPFILEKHKSFKDILDGTRTDITEIDLFNAATLWKDFNTAFPSNNFKSLSLREKITGVKSDFENSITKAIKKFAKDHGYPVKYINDFKTDFKPIFLIDAPTSVEVLLAVGELYDLLKGIIGQPEYSSLKQLMILRYFATIFVIPIVNGRSFNHNYYQFPEYVFRDSAFSELKLHQVSTYPMPDELIENLRISSWIEVFLPMNDIYLLQADYVNMRLLAEHLADLLYFDKSDKMDEFGTEIIINHLQLVTLKLQPLFQSVIDRLAAIIELFELNILDSETEAIYLEDMREIRNNLFPTSKGDEVKYEAKLTMDIIVEWVKRLSNLNNSWGRFMLVLQSKALQRYKDQLIESDSITHD